MKWLLFILLSFTWGSSFILMKEGLIALNAWQVASIRIIASGLVLLPLAIRNFRLIPTDKRLLVFLSGSLGSLIPAYLFCMAEKEIDSALAGVLNSLTPIFVIVAGALFFKAKTTAIKVLGIMVAFAGSVLLFFSQPGFAQSSHAFPIFLVVVATALYGINVNMVGKFLHDIPSLQIASVALALNSIPALLVLIFTGYFSKDFSDPAVLISTGYSALLGIAGTAIATILFYKLLKMAGPVFSSMVTYGIPIVAIGWGILYGEKIGLAQVGCMIVILAGVFIANMKRKTIS